MRDSLSEDSVFRNEPEIIDADVHNMLKDGNDLLEYLPRVWHEQWKAASQIVPMIYQTSVSFLHEDAIPEDGGLPGSDPHFMLKHHLQAFGIDYAILTGQGFELVSLHPDPDYGNAIASAYNDYLIENWLKVSPKYKGSIIINVNDPEAAVKEIDRMGSHPDMVQVLIASGSRLLYGQRFYHPIYEAAERNGLPVAIHPGSEGRGIAYPPTPAGFPTRYLEWHNALPINIMAQTNSLVCEGVFERFPGLKFVMIEGGVAWLPHLMWRMDKNYKALRDSVPWLKKLPSEYIKEHIRLTTQPIEEPEDREQLTQIFKMINAEKTLMYSSDYPHWDYDPPKKMLPPMPREMKQRIMSGTAMELYGLKEKPATVEADFS